MNAQLANRLWLLTSRRAAKNFHHAAQHVTETQARLLQTYLTRNRDTLYLSTQVHRAAITNYHLPLTIITSPTSSVSRTESQTS